MSKAEDDPAELKIIWTDRPKAFVRFLGAIAFSAVGFSFVALIALQLPVAAILIFTSMFFGLVAAKNLLLLVAPQKLTVASAGFHFDGLERGQKILWGSVEKFRLSRSGHAVVFRLKPSAERPRLPSRLPWDPEQDADAWIPHSLTLNPSEVLDLLESKRRQSAARSNV